MLVSTLGHSRPDGFTLAFYFSLVTLVSLVPLLVPLVASLVSLLVFLLV